MIRRIFAITKKEFIHLLNDWWLPAFMLFGGVMELFMVGWATSRPIANLPMMVLDLDKTPASRQIVVALENAETFDLQAQVYQMADIERAMQHGTINVAVIIPPDYSEKLASPRGQAVLSVLVNGAESIPGNAALRALDGLSRQLGQDITIQRLGLDPEAFAGFDPSMRVWFNEGLKDSLYTTPAELGLMLEFTILLFAGLSFSRERELGTLEQLLVMPFSSLELIIGKGIPVVLVGASDFALMLAMTHFAFEVPSCGSRLLLAVLATGYVMVELGKGMVISVVSHTQHQAFLLVMLVGMTDFMFTGYAVPVEGMPKALQGIANFVPAYHWLTILRGILLKGAGLEVLWPNVAALVGLGAVIGSFSWWYVRRALD